MTWATKTALIVLDRCFRISVLSSLIFITLTAKLTGINYLQISAFDFFIFILSVPSLWIAKLTGISCWQISSFDFFIFILSVFQGKAREATYFPQQDLFSAPYSIPPSPPPSSSSPSPVPQPSLILLSAKGSDWIPEWAFSCLHLVPGEHRLPCMELSHWALRSCWKIKTI